MKISINIRKSKKTAGPAKKAKPKRKAIWRMQEKTSRQRLVHISFFDGTTLYDPTKQDWVVWEPFAKGHEAVRRLTPTTVTPYGNYVTTFVQNSRPVPTVEQFARVGATNPGFLTNKKPLKGLTLADYEGNKKFLPVSRSAPNIQVELLATGEKRAVASADLLSIFRGENSDVMLLQDGAADPESLGYTFTNVFDFGHIRVTEKTASALYTMGFGGLMNVFNPANTDYSFIAGEDTDTSPLRYAVRRVFDMPYSAGVALQYRIEGINWTSFDTSDTDNFKVTRERYFTADAVGGNESLFTPGLSQDRIKLHLIPRLWWSMQRFNDGQNSTQLGIFKYPPTDIALPKPREGGNWEISHSFFDQASTPQFITARDYPVVPNDSWARDITSLNDSNRTVTFHLPGDSEDYIGFHILHEIPHDENTAFSNVDTQWVDRPKARMLAEMSIPMTDPHVRFWWGGDGGFVGVTLGGSYPETVTSFTRRPGNDFASASGWHSIIAWGFERPVCFPAFFGSAPDGKIPITSSDREPISNTPFRFSHFYATPFGRGVAREYAPLQTASYGHYDPFDFLTYQKDEIEKIELLRHYFLDDPSVTIDKTKKPTAWFLGVAGARAGDLVGIIETDLDMFYVWRKTDENLRYSGPGIIADGEESATAISEDLTLGGRYHLITFDFNSHTVSQHPGCIDVAQMTPPRFLPRFWQLTPNPGGFYDYLYYDKDRFLTSAIYHFFGSIEYETISEKAVELGDVTLPFSEFPYFTPKIRYWGAHFRRWPDTKLPTANDGPFTKQIDLGCYVRPMMYQYYDPMSDFERIPVLMPLPSRESV